MTPQQADDLWAAAFGERLEATLPAAASHEVHHHGYVGKAMLVMVTVYRPEREPEPFRVLVPPENRGDMDRFAHRVGELLGRRPARPR